MFAAFLGSTIPMFSTFHDDAVNMILIDQIEIQPYHNLFQTVLFNQEVLCLEFPGVTRSDILLTDLAKPDQKVMIHFSPRSGSKKVGLKANRSYYIIDDELYERMNYKDFNMVKPRGLVGLRRRDKRLCHYLRIPEVEQKQELIDFTKKYLAGETR